jgi:mannan endo-1,4-beta-mannosidase
VIIIREKKKIKKDRMSVFLRAIFICSAILAILIILVLFIYSSSPPSKPEFIEQRGEYLFLKDQRFRFVGGNHYDLLVKYLSEDASTGKQVFVDSKNNKISVIRFWATCSNGYWSNQCLFSGPNNWKESKEKFFEKFDSLIQDAEDNGIYLIPVLVEGYDSFTEQSGGSGICQVGGQEGRNEVCQVGGQANLLYKTFVRDVVTRYRDRSIILAWDIGNEGNRHCSNEADLINWYEDTADYIKSLDSNHLISTGEDNFGTMDPTVFKSINSIGNISLVSVHIYEKDLFNLESDINGDQGKINHFVSYWTNISHEEIKKPIYFGEFGTDDISTSPEFYGKFLNASYRYDVDGAVFWSWMEGGDCKNPITLGGSCVSPERTPSVVKDITYWSKEFGGYGN